MEEFFLYQCSYSVAVFLLRLAVAAVILPFGATKFLNRKHPPEKFPAVLGLNQKMSFYLALFAETFAPFCLVFGFFTRIAALGGMLNMGVAYYVDTKEQSFKTTPFYYAQALPILLGYILVFILGPGNFSLDYLIF